MNAPRIDHATASPGAARAMFALEKHVAASTLGKGLYELIKIRASQINGCAYCLDMHTQDARGMGETEQRIYALSAWRETPFFTPRERAALAWTEALTLIALEQRVPDELFDATREQFSETEIVDLTIAVNAINGWNRMAIAFGMPVGTYKPAARAG